jgi:hypothetical protein
MEVGPDGGTDVGGDGMTTYTVQEDCLPTVEAHIVKRTDLSGEFAVLTFRYTGGYGTRKIEFFLSEIQLMQLSNAITCAAANVRPTIADMDEEGECAEPTEDELHIDGEADRIHDEKAQEPLSMLDYRYKMLDIVSESVSKALKGEKGVGA